MFKGEFIESACARQCMPRRRRSPVIPRPPPVCKPPRTKAGWSLSERWRLWISLPKKCHYKT
jgi:hypothetical protein